MIWVLYALGLLLLSKLSVSVTMICEMVPRSGLPSHGGAEKLQWLPEESSPFSKPARGSAQKLSTCSVDGELL